MNLFRRLFLLLTTRRATYEAIMEDARDKAELRRNLRRLESAPAFDPEAAALAAPFRRLNPIEIQLVLRDMHFADVASALCLLDGSTALRFIVQMADRGQILMLEEMQQAQKRSIQKNKHALRRMASAVHSLPGHPDYRLAMNNKAAESGRVRLFERFRKFMKSPP